VTNRITAIPYRPGHLDFLFYRNVSSPREALEKRLAVLSAIPNSISMTVLLDSMPIAIVGGALKWPGVAEAWSVLSDEIQRVPKLFSTYVLGFVESAMASHSLHRLEVTVLEGHATGQRWAEFLGFKNEGLMQGYGADGSNHFLYARVQP
jgi:hypothetical protein